MQTFETTDTAAQAGERTVRVWDLFVRVFHWTVVVAFFVAFFTEDDVLLVHVWAGYLVGALVLLRLLWGVVGTRYARFSDFVYKPGTMLRYALDLALFRSKRHLGHSPAGGAMVLALLASLAVTVVTGMAVYGAEKKAGPLAPLFAQGELVAPSVALVPAVRAEDNEREERREAGKGRKGERGERSEVWEEVHEFFANLTLLLVILHIGGVLFASIAHRENLIRAMITGRKRA